jgi:hypothetical protein
MTMRSQPGASSLLLLASGFALWGLAFAALYAMLSIGCALGWQGVELVFGFTLQRLQLVFLLAIFLLAHAALLFGLRPRDRSTDATGATRFVRTTSFLAAAAALAATALTFTAVVILSSCTH